MKKIIFALFIVLSISSCRKDYICTVEWDMKTGAYGVYQHYTHSEQILNTSQNEADMFCNETVLQGKLDEFKSKVPINGTYSIH